MATPRFPIAPDRMIYFVLCRYNAGLAWAERDVGDTDRATTIKHIRNGELPDVVQVIELNVVEFSSRDVTEDILAEVSTLRRQLVDAVMSRFDRLIADLDHARDYRKHEVV